MAELAAEPMMPGADAPVQDEAAADPRAQRKEQRAAKVLRRARDDLAEGGAVRVVAEKDRTLSQPMLWA